MGGIILELWVLLGLVALNALFAGAEIAVVTLRPTRVRALVAEKRAGAEALARLRESPERFLATVQIGITVVSSSAGAFGGQVLVGRLHHILSRLPLAGSYADEIAFGLVVGALSYLSLVLGELVPKSLALRKSEIYALWMAQPLHLLARFCRPLVWLLTASSNLILRFFGDHTSFSETRVSREEVQQLLQEATRVGELDPRVGDIATRALGFGDLSAADVMIPRPQIIALDISSPYPEARERISSTPHSRFPIYAQTIDNILGYVASKDALSMRDIPDFNLQHIMRDVPFFPETMRAVDVLQSLQRARKHLGIVVDERGCTAGLLTTEDLVEELVGELFAEGDNPQQPAIRDESNGVFLVPGNISVREMNRTLELNLPVSEQWSTLAGLFIGIAGHLPQQGESLITHNGIRLDAVEVNARRVQMIRVHRPGLEKKAEATEASTPENTNKRSPDIARQSLSR